MKVCVGGTFDILHKGHEALLGKAFAVGTEIFIGLSSDKMVRKQKSNVSSFKKRKDNLNKFLKKKNLKNYHIVKINDRYGPAISEDFDVIVVSSETKKTAVEINSIRKQKKLKPLKIIEVPLVLAEDSLPVSSTRIRRKEINSKGELLRPLKVKVGSLNPVKINAVKNIFSLFFKKLEVKGVKSGLKLDKEPLGYETVQGAISRAKAALKDADYGVGIEAGLFWNAQTKNYFDVQYCAIIDKTGRVTLGHGPGFIYPQKIIALVKSGKTVGKAMERLYGFKDIGRKTGAISYFSKGVLDRTELTEQAILMALIPRLRREDY